MLLCLLRRAAELPVAMQQLLARQGLAAALAAAGQLSCSSNYADGHSSSSDAELRQEAQQSILCFLAVCGNARSVYVLCLLPQQEESNELRATGVMLAATPMHTVFQNDNALGCTMSWQDQRQQRHLDRVPAGAADGGCHGGAPRPPAAAGGRPQQHVQVGSQCCTLSGHHLAFVNLKKQ